MDVICQVCCIDVLLKLSKACYVLPRRRKLGHIPDLRFPVPSPVHPDDGDGGCVILPIGDLSPHLLPGYPPSHFLWRSVFYRKAYILLYHQQYIYDHRYVVYTATERPYVFQQYRQSPDGSYVLCWDYLGPG